MEEFLQLCHGRVVLHQSFYVSPFFKENYTTNMKERKYHMSKKNAWSEIYENFQSLYPNLKKEAIGYHPHGYMSILVYFPNGLRMVYNEIERRAKFVAA